MLSPSDNNVQIMRPKAGDVIRQLASPWQSAHKGQTSKPRLRHSSAAAIGAHSLCGLDAAKHNRTLVIKTFG